MQFEWMPWQMALHGSVAAIAYGVWIYFLFNSDRKMKPKGDTE